MVVNSLIDMINHKYEQLQGLLDDSRHEVRPYLHYNNITITIINKMYKKLFFIILK